MPIRHEDGSIDFWIGTATDIDDRKRTEEAQRFLLDAGAELSRSLDWRAGLKAVARVAVPRVADWCAVHVVEDGRHDLVARDRACRPAKVIFAREVQERYPPRRDNPRGAAEVIRSGTSQLISEIPADAFAAAAQDETHEQLLRELGIRSFICVPVQARGRTLGAITLVSAESGRRYTEADLRTTEELALRVGAVAENAQLYEEVERRARAARALETIADGVVLLDDEERVLLWNNAAAGDHRHRRRRHPRPPGCRGAAGLRRQRRSGRRRRPAADRAGRDRRQGALALVLRPCASRREPSTRSAT